LTLPNFEGYIKSYIVLPPTIYGLATGPLFDAGISNPHSIQIPTLVKAAIARRQAGIIGEGKNVWPNVDIHEREPLRTLSFIAFTNILAIVADFYNLLLDATVTSRSDLGHGREGIYHAVNGEYNFYVQAEAISQALVSLGLGDNPLPSTFSAEEEKNYFGVSLLRLYDYNILLTNISSLLLLSLDRTHDA